MPTRWPVSRTPAAGSELLDRADDLVADDDRPLMRREVPFDHMQIGPAAGAAPDADEDLPRAGLGLRHVRATAKVSRRCRPAFQAPWLS